VSPLSSVSSPVEWQLEAEIRPKNTGMLDMTFVDDAREGSKEIAIAAKPSAPLVEYTVTKVKSKADEGTAGRSQRFKELSFLPGDAGMLALVTMQRIGCFTSKCVLSK